MGFKNNYAEADMGNNIKPEGDYECIIQKIEERTTRNGATGLNISMVIRNDVEQKFRNGFIFHTLWKRREPTEMDKQVNGYGFGQVMALGKSAGLPDGKDYESLTEFCNDLINKPVRVNLKHEEYNGKMQERVNYLNPTKFPEVKHIPKSTSQQNGFTAPAQQSFANQNATAPAIQTGYADMPTDEDLPF